MSNGGTLCNRNDGKIMVTYVLKAINLPCNVLNKSIQASVMAPILQPELLALSH